MPIGKAVQADLEDDDQVVAPPPDEELSDADVATAAVTAGDSGDALENQDSEEAVGKAAAQAEEMLDLRRAAAQYGLDLSGHPDDDAALKDLVERARRAQAMEQLSPYLQDYLQNKAEYEAYLQQRRQAAAPPQAPPEAKPERKFWEAPEWNPQWLTMVRKDDSGQLVPDFAAGGTPEIASKVQKFIHYRQEQQEKFWSDPFNYIQEFVDRRADERARSLIQQEIGSYSEQQDARQFIAQNRDWLLAHDDKGQLMTDPQGGPQLSHEGQRFMGHLQVATEQYQMDPQRAKAYALDMLQRDRALAMMQQGRPADVEGQDAKKKVQFLQKAAGFTPSQAASTNRKSDANGDLPPQDSTLSLEELMRRNLKAAGITDEDIASTH